MVGDPLIERLAGIVGDAHVLVDADLRAPYEADWTGRFSGTARCVVRPGSTSDVAAVLRVCSDMGVPVVPQGGNSGLVGGSVPRGGEVLLSLRHLDWIDALDERDASIVVGAGATLGEVQRTVRAHGWDVGVDLGARDSATVGGMVATNAGGMHVARYGPMVEQVIGLEAVLAGGSTIGRVPGLRKDNTGYRWPGLLAGSEGTLAVITRVHLALVPRLPERVAAIVGVADFDAAVGLCAKFRRDLHNLDALEGFDDAAMESVCEFAAMPRPFPGAHAVYVLVECAGPEGSTGALLDELTGGLALAPEVLASAVGADEPTVSRLWSYRELIPESVNARGVPHKLDVTLPGSRLPHFASAVRSRISEVAPHAETVLFGHLGDGNLHVNILGLTPGDEFVDDAVLDLVIAMDGSISAEHGIGIVKRAALARARSTAEIDAMRAVRGALDPGGILNPGVIFD